RARTVFSNVGSSPLFAIAAIAFCCWAIPSSIAGLKSSSLILKKSGAPYGNVLSESKGFSLFFIWFSLLFESSFSVAFLQATIIVARIKREIAFFIFGNLVVEIYRTCKSNIELFQLCLYKTE